MVFLVNLVFFGLLVPFFKWVYSASYISNRLFVQIVVLFIGWIIWGLVYGYSLDKYCYKLKQKYPNLAGNIFSLLHLIFVIVERKKITVINYWNFSLVICFSGFMVSYLFCLILKNKEKEAIEEKTKKEKEDAEKAEEERIEREKRLDEKNRRIEEKKREEDEKRKLFSSERLRLVFQIRDKYAKAWSLREIVLTLFSEDGLSREFLLGSFNTEKNNAHDLETGLKNKLAGLDLGSYLTDSDLEAFCYVVADEIVNNKASQQIITKNDKSWTIKAEELKKKKEREAEELRKREEEKYLADSVLELYFSVSNSDRFSENAEIILTTLNRDGEKTETSLGEYKRVKRKNGSRGFVASELKLDFKPDLLKLLKDDFSDYIQKSDRMDFCEVVIDELLTKDFSEQVFTRIEDEAKGETSGNNSNEENEKSYYFGLFGLRNDASMQDVERSYKEMMKFWHPDQFAGNKKKQAEAEEHSKQLNEAYSWLKIYFQG